MNSRPSDVHCAQACVGSDHRRSQSILEYTQRHSEMPVPHSITSLTQWHGNVLRTGCLPTWNAPAMTRCGVLVTSRLESLPNRFNKSEISLQEQHYFVIFFVQNSSKRKDRNVYRFLTSWFVQNPRIMYIILELKSQDFVQNSTICMGGKSQES